MRFDEHLAALREEGADLAGAAREAGVDAPVPTCPGWAVADVVAHQGVLHRWVTRLCEGRPEHDPEWRSSIVAPTGRDLLEWYADGVEPLVRALAAAGADAPVWSWGPVHTAGFWARRMAHETAMHRCDVELAAGREPAIAVARAIDGIDELLRLAGFHPQRRIVGAGETVHLHCTDGDGEWLVRMRPDGIEVTREHGKGDVAARGSASALLLALSGRAPLEEIEVLGDAALLDRFCDQIRA